MRALIWLVFALSGCLSATLASYPVRGEEGSLLLQWSSAVGGWFALSLTLTIAAALYLRRTQAHKQGSEAQTQRLRKPAEWLRDVAHALDSLPTPEEEGWREEIEEALGTHLNQVIEAREALISSRGLLWYARFSDEFGRVERNLSRAWSACTDGANQEAAQALQRGRAALDRSIAILDEGEPPAD